MVDIQKPISSPLEVDWKDELLAAIALIAGSCGGTVKIRSSGVTPEVMRELDKIFSPIHVAIIHDSEFAAGETGARHFVCDWLTFAPMPPAVQ
jgi:hypothetical protein